MTAVKNMYISDAHRPSSLGAMTRARPRAQAFSIVEVMFAVGVMALVLTTSITTLQRGFLSLDTARNVTIAGQIMQCEMEKVRMKSWTEISAFPTTGKTTETIDSSFTSNTVIGSRFTLYRDVTVIDMGTSAGMRQITYSVTWKSYDGRTLSRNYTTYYGQNGLYDYFYNSI